MTVRVAINGFGRIGRNILRAIYESGRISANLVCDQFGKSYEKIDFATDYLQRA